MGKKLYVGNLGYNVSSSDLQQLFTPHGTVQSAQVIEDRDAGRSKGFGFVEMGSDEEAHTRSPHSMPDARRARLDGERSQAACTAEQFGGYGSARRSALCQVAPRR